MTDETRSNDDFDPTDPILAAWTDQGEADDLPYLATDPSTLADSVAEAHRKDQRRLLWLNVREVVPSVVLTGVFGSLVFDSEHPAALLIASLLCLAVACFLVGSSIRHHRADLRWGTSVRDQLARRIAQLNHRAWMYRNLAWWYFLPLGLAIALVLYGLGGRLGGGPETVYAVVVGLSGVFMYRKSRAHGRARYESEIERLAPLLAEFDRTV